MSTKSGAEKCNPEQEVVFTANLAEIFYFWLFYLGCYGRHSVHIWGPILVFGRKIFGQKFRVIALWVHLQFSIEN